MDYSFDLVRDFARTGTDLIVNANDFTKDEVEEIVKDGTSVGSNITLRGLHKFGREEIRDFVKASLGDDCDGEPKTARLTLEF